MSFTHFIPTKLIAGKHCVQENASLFAGFGKKAILVTGKTSAKLSGALEDVQKVLNGQNIEYCVYDKITSNPEVESCFIGGQFAKEEHADFVIAIGGGSPLDAAKAVAAYATNDLKPLEIYNGIFAHKPLSIIAIPTTAGTGSEVTPYSILTVREEENKKSFTSEDIFPKIAFLDARYTENLPYEITVDTAIDAMSHGIESILNRRNSPASELYALGALKIIGRQLLNLKNQPLSFETRQDLLYASSLAGMAISHTGTVIVHSMGYSLTYFKDIPHGRANGMLLPVFMELAEKYVPQEAKKVTDALGMQSVSELNKIILSFIQRNHVLTQTEAQKFAEKSIQAKNIVQCLWTVTKENELEMFETLI